MTDVDSSFRELLGNLDKLCLKFKPSIFPKSFTPTVLADFFDESLHNSQYVKSMMKEFSSDDIAFVTVVDVAARQIRISDIKIVDTAATALLYHPEQVIKLMSTGTDTELNLAVGTFLQVSGHSMSVEDARHIFIETFNSIYALRVLISNTPGFKVCFDESGAVLPTAEETIAKRFLKMVQQARVKKEQFSAQQDHKKDNKSNFSSDEDNSSEDEDVMASTKKSKQRRKRSKKA